MLLRTNYHLKTECTQCGQDIISPRLCCLAEYLCVFCGKYIGATFSSVLINRILLFICYPIFLITYLGKNYASVLSSICTVLLVLTAAPGTLTTLKVQKFSAVMTTNQVFTCFNTSFPSVFSSPSIYPLLALITLSFHINNFTSHDKCFIQFFSKEVKESSLFSEINFRNKFQKQTFPKAFPCEKIVV